MKTLRRGSPLLIILLLAACAAPAPRPNPAPLARKPQAAPPRLASAPRPASSTANASVSAAGTRPQVKLYAPGIKDGAPSADEIPANLASIPDAVPRREARSLSGNPPEYEAFGEVYKVMDDANGFHERGFASWYGKKFNGRNTSSGEPYDMYAMTGAHKTLPIPSYVRVTNLDNGKAVVVRINDRGPFHSDRIIDLSYTAAAKLELIGHGTSEVEVEALVPDDDAPVLASKPAAPAPVMQQVSAVAASATPSGASLWLQIASFTDRINALNMRDKLQSLGLEVSIRDAKNGALHRVVVGPFASDYDAQPMAGRLHSAGYPALRLYD